MFNQTRFEPHGWYSAKSIIETSGVDAAILRHAANTDQLLVGRSRPVAGPNKAEGWLFLGRDINEWLGSLTPHPEDQ